MIFWGMPVTSKDIVTYMVGQLSGMLTMALALYFTKSAGQDAADEAKTVNTGKMADAITATAQAGAGQPSDAIREGDSVTIDRTGKGPTT
jgi:hypothetical protein